MAEFRDAFDRTMAHLGPDGWAHHVEHMAALAARSGTKKAADLPKEAGG